MSSRLFRRCAAHRATTTFFLISLFLYSSVAYSQPSESLKDTANFLAGFSAQPSSPLHPLTQTDAYKRFAKLMRNDWSVFENATGKPLRKWTAKWISESPETVFYPFAGPDFLNAYLMYPKAKRYVLVGLEHGANAPPLRDYKPKTLANGLSTFRTALMTLTHVNFFVTNKMEVEIDAAPIPGVTPVILAAMGHLGLEPLSVRPVLVNGNGKLMEAPETSTLRKGKWGGYDSVVIAFKGADGQQREVVYLSMDISNEGLTKAPYRQEYYRGLGEFASLIKAGSYLLHLTDFTLIRDILLKQSVVHVQDDSGIPVRIFRFGNEWNIKPFGVYTTPIHLFKNKAQPALQELYAKGADPLPFKWSYGNEKKQSNLLLCRRRVAKKPPGVGGRQ